MTGQPSKESSLESMDYQRRGLEVAIFISVEKDKAGGKAMTMAR